MRDFVGLKGFVDILALSNNSQLKRMMLKLEITKIIPNAIRTNVGILPTGQNILIKKPSNIKNIKIYSALTNTLAWASWDSFLLVIVTPTLHY